MPEGIAKELRECADMVSELDEKMLTLNNEIQEISEEEGFL